ncbi:hypothetical protein [Acinetobacter terrae]|uniref:hypothetical protein n=1 Tax=Acinetobacter terrae TaxID=2731247 RepID=UPI0007D77484|nr:hypothetical protein [Acinetobacter terrae]OAL78066.1 hypothetical protein AY608_06515 [Acinetobacter terrae]OTG76411.1 hypothetical protein B9T23_08930 [Acinetobacter terrae]
MKRIGCSIFTLLSVLLTGCGGSGTGDNFNSSFEKTFTFGSQTYVCRSEKAANACGGTSQDCSACELQSSSSPVITQVCAQPVANTHRVTTDGCVLRLTNDTQTGICTSEGLRLLSGINWTKQQVSAGTLFSRGSLSITVGNLTETITCN